jgi:murein L,D-transpeptidase YafK
VPEGLYKINGLNPNSAFHLSMKLNYPNTFDVVKSKLDGRDNLGGDIFIHGRSDSVGCLAMGDRTIEELFVLTALVGEDNVEVIIAPTDFRDSARRQRNRPRLQWLPELYSNIKQALTRFKND